jgi:hypothetical protein
MPRLLATSRSSTTFHAMILAEQVASCGEGCRVEVQHSFSSITVKPHAGVLLEHNST